MSDNYYDYLGDLPLADETSYLGDDFMQRLATVSGGGYGPGENPTPYTSPGLGGTEIAGGDSWLSRMLGSVTSLNGGQLGGLLGGLGTAGLGIAGIAQALAGGDRETTQTVNRNVAPQSPQELQALQQALAFLTNGASLATGAGPFGPQGLAGVIGGQMTGADQMRQQALAAYGQAGQQSQVLGGALAPLLARIPELAAGQAGSLGALSQLTQGQPGPMLTPGTPGTPGTPATPARTPTAESLRAQAINVDSELGRLIMGNPTGDLAAGYGYGAGSPGTPGTSGTPATYGPGTPAPVLPNNDLYRTLTSGASALAGPGMNQAGALMNQQMGLVDPANQYRVDPAVLSALNAQALGAAQGNLPALNDQIRNQVGQVYEGRMQDVNRYADTGLRDALERARAMGFHGGMEVFREGAPGALVDRTMAEATRQVGTLAGQRAEQELALAQALPMLGANLAGAGANLGFSQNAQNRGLADLMGGLMTQRLALPQLAAGLESGRVGANAGAVNALANASGAYNTPIATGMSGGLNLVNLNQNLAASLGGFANQPITQGIGLIGALSGGAGAANALASTQQAGRLGAAGTTQTSSQPFNLLDAFAPTAQLLGGLGGLFQGINGTSRTGFGGLS